MNAHSPDPLLTRQIELEIEMAGIGRDRYFSKVRKDIEKERGYETATGRCILDASVGPVADGIRRFLAEANSGKAGRPHKASRLIKGMDPDVVAYLAFRAILGRLMKPGQPMLIRLATVTAKAVELEARFSEFAAQEPDKFKWKLKELSEDGATEAHKAKVLTFAMNKHGVSWDRWSKDEMIHLGIKLIEIVMETTGLIAIGQAHEVGDIEARRDAHLVHLTNRAGAWIDQSVQQGSVLAMAYMPTLVPPKPWDDIRGGGYYTALDRPLPLVRRARPEQLELLKNADLTIVYKALNAIQSTPWRVNRRILDVVKALSEGGAGVGGLVGPDAVAQERPDESVGKRALDEWRWAARDIRAANIQRAQDRLKEEQMIALAAKFADERAFYYPHNLDFRGRAYPVVDVLQPQGADAAKGMLELANAKTMSVDGARWLAIHGSNCFGVDKVDFDDRVKFIADNERQIVQCALDPYEQRWWTEADSPFCFLAFCFEWASYLADPETFTTRIPIAQDGSCNGLQHFSAMLRDHIGGSAVNLIPADKPQDIYQRVADRVMAVLRRFASDGGSHPKAEEPGPKAKGPTPAQIERWSHTWLSLGVDRKVTKRPVMVLPYGGTPRSCLKYVGMAVKEKGVPLNLGDEEKKATGYLSSTIWDSIGDVVVAARQAMDWLQKSARTIAGPMWWTAPSGFPVFQGYLDMRRRLIETKISGRRYQLLAPEERDEIDVSKQATAISPNFVHSLDAAAMMLTVCALVDDGVTDFAMIHDSYGTHAGNASLLARRLREQFVEMYQTDVLERLRNQLLDQNPGVELPELPTKGDLDLNEVLNSKFFFA